MGNELNSDIFHDLPHLRAGIGVDLSAGHAAIVRARTTRKGLTYETLLDVVASDLTQPLRDTLRGVQAELAMGHTYLAAALPVASSSSRWLTAPYPALAKAKRVFPALLDIELPLPLESCAYGFMDAHIDDNQVRALALAAPLAGINKRLEELQANKLDPHVLDHEGIALWRHHRRQHPESDGLQFVVYLGTDRTVWVAGKGNQFLGAQSTQATYHTAHQTLTPDASATGLQNWRDRSLRFLRTWVKYARDQRPVIYWVGPGVVHADSLANLQKDLSEIDASHTQHDGPSHFLAAALAAHLVAPESNSINFRTGADTHPLVHRLHRRSLTRIAVVAGIAALCVAVLNVAVNRMIDNKIDRANADIAERAQTITGTTRLPRRQEVTLARRTMTDADHAIRPIAALYDRPLVDELDQLLAWTEANDWTLDSLYVDEHSIRLHGTLPHRAAAQTLVNQLEESGWIVNRQLQSGQETDRFDIRLTGERAP